jgi:hypothetical protein
MKLACSYTLAPFILLTARRLTEALSQRNIGKIGSPHMLKARLRYITPLFASIEEYMLTHHVRHTSWARLMFELLHVTPWNRFPLVIHWLTQVRRGLLCV